jgi:D-xylose 1-dehydrogenase (NADP+, D-xylono-1,5-lactone-forming)
VFPGLVRAEFGCALTMDRRETYEVVGTEGSLSVDAAFLPGTGPVTILEHHGQNEPIVHTIEGADEYRLMVEHFADAVLEGRPLRYSAREAAGNMAAIEALHRSARNGAVTVPIDSSSF